MVPFDSNVDIWMKELTKSLLLKMIDKAVRGHPSVPPVRLDSGRIFTVPAATPVSIKLKYSSKAFKQQNENFEHFSIAQKK